MTPIKQQGIFWVALSAIVLMFGTSAQADTNNAEPVVTEQKTDFSGKPPFKRTRVKTTLETPTSASAERAATHRVGAPGKSRLHTRAARSDLATASLARFEAIETVEQPRQNRRRIGPPGKQNPSLQSHR
ncbi:MAG: hypothetical protein AAF290_13765 [Pseudomonadota bacterium]